MLYKYISGIKSSIFKLYFRFISIKNCYVIWWNKLRIKLANST